MSKNEPDLERKQKIREQIGVLLICLVLALSGYLLLQSGKNGGGVDYVSGNKESRGVQTSPTPALSKTANDSAPVSVGKVNINSANLEDLDKLPGVGPATAQKIIDYRNSHGNFTSIEAIKEVNGIGDSKFNNMKDQISI